MTGVSGVMGVRLVEEKIKGNRRNSDDDGWGGHRALFLCKKKRFAKPSGTLI